MSHFFSIYFAKIRTFCLKAKIITLFSAKSGPVALACSGKHCGLRFNDAGRYAQKSPRIRVSMQGTVQNGGYLLSRLRSTIGAGGLNCSVRNGKRWNPVA